MKRTNSMRYEQSDEARELILYIEDTWAVWQRLQDTLDTLRKHVNRGNYNTDKAVNAYYRLATLASDIYNREFGYRFTVTERFSAAVDMERDYREDLELENTEIFEEEDN